MQTERTAQEHLFVWDDGQAVSRGSRSLATGAFGTLLVPAGSDLIGKAMNVVAHSPDGRYADTGLLATPKVLAVGPNHFTHAEIAEIGAVRNARISVSAPVTGEQSAVLLWKF